MKKKELGKYLPIVMIILLIFLSFLIVRSYILSLLSAFILAYLVKPVYEKLVKISPKPIAAALCIILILVIIFLPIAAIIGGIVNQAYTSLDSQTITSTLSNISESSIIKNLNLDVNEIVNRSLEFLITLLTNITTQLPSILVTIFITIFGIYYILIDWKPLTQKLTKYLPTENKKRLTKDISLVTKNLVYGTLLIALIEFIVAMVGFYISGVQYYLLLPTIIAILAFIPGLGATIVWIPLALILLIKQSYFSAIGVIITGLIISLFIDTIFRAKISGKATKTHPLIILIGILGGISVFGIFGFIIGPLVLSYAIEILEDISESNR